MIKKQFYSFFFLNSLNSKLFMLKKNHFQSFIHNYINIEHLGFYESDIPEVTAACVVTVAVVDEEVVEDGVLRKPVNSERNASYSFFITYDAYISQLKLNCVHINFNMSHSSFNFKTFYFKLILVIFGV